MVAGSVVEGAGMIGEGGESGVKMHTLSGGVKNYKKHLKRMMCIGARGYLSHRECRNKSLCSMTLCNMSPCWNMTRIRGKRGGTKRVMTVGGLRRMRWRGGWA